jgi:hypothetical protein
MCWECWFSCREILRNKDSGWKTQLAQLNSPQKTKPRMIWTDNLPPEYKDTQRQKTTNFTLSQTLAWDLCATTVAQIMAYGIWCFRHPHIATSRISATKSTSKNSTKTMTKNQLKHVTPEATPFFKILPSHISIHLKHTGARRGTCCLVLSQTSSQPLHGTYCAQKD